jgi:hypothetical protein
VDRVAVHLQRQAHLLVAQEIMAAVAAVVVLGLLEMECALLAQVAQVAQIQAVAAAVAAALKKVQQVETLQHQAQALTAAAVSSRYFSKEIRNGTFCRNR